MAGYIGWDDPAEEYAYMVANEEAVRAGETIGSQPNRWHLIDPEDGDTGIGPVVTRCHRVIDRSIAHTASRIVIEREKETSRVRRCKRCWAL